MKIAVIIVRVLLGALFLFASLAVLLHLNMGKQPEMNESQKKFMEGIMATGYLFPLIKYTELVCAISFLAGRYVTLANLVIFPVSLNIFLYHAFIGPDGLATAAFVLAANLFLIYAYRKNYLQLLAARLF